MTTKKPRDIGLKRRLQEASDEERAILLEGLPYEVGYGKPPIQRQFQKGRSGNRRGRPKGSENLGKVAVEEFSETVNVQEHGKHRKLTKQRVAMRQLSNKAATGDPKAISLMVDIQRKTGQLEQIEAPAISPVDERDIEAFGRLLEFLSPNEASDEDDVTGSNVDVQRDLINGLRGNFTAFAVKAFNIVNPGQEFVPTPAFLAISHKLAEVEAGRIRRLLINVPPRSGKSLLASIALPAFILGCDPTRRIVCASYSGELSAKLSRDCRTVMTHPSYGILFPATVIAGKNTEAELETAHGGYRYSTSVGGTLTGRGGNFIVIDDPIKPDEAMSELARDRVWAWFTGTVGSRLDNKAEDAIVVTMQRVHADDLAGRLIEQGGWDVLTLPAIVEIEQKLVIAPDRTITRKIGDVLDPVREPREVLDQIKRELGSRTFEAQYQQQPVPEEGGLVQWRWFATYDAPPNRAANDRLVISWDTAQKDREVNDYSAAVVALVKPNRHVFILDVIRERLDFPALRRRVEQEATRWRPATTLIEAAGTGIALIQDLNNRVQVIGIQPIGEKVVRFSAVTPAIEAGQVHLPARAPWLETFKRELLAFPASKNDDQVDAFSQLLTWVRNRPGTAYVSSYSYASYADD